jgi:integrase
LHKASGQAVCEVRGKTYYLGAYDSPESRREYDRVVKFWREVRQVPKNRPLPAGASLPPPADLTVAEIIAAFWTHAHGYYADCVLPNGKVCGELDNYRLALRPLRRLYDGTPAASFSPLKLKAVRADALKPREERDPKTGKVRKLPGWCRTNANRHTSRIKSVFKWAVENELLPAAFYHGLSTVGGLRFGKCDARESAPVQPVPDAHVDAILPLLPPPVAAMVQVQRLTGARPAEVCAMRGVDLDTTGPVWLYRPTAHKNKWRGHERIIYLGPAAQAIVRPYLKLDATAHLFNPADALAWMRERRGKHRKTPMSCGNVAGAKRVRNPMRRPRERYDVNAYRRCIARACERAGVPHFHPHRLRHSAATEWRKRYGPDAALVMLGDKTTRMIDVYAEKDHDRAREIAAQIG